MHSRRMLLPAVVSAVLVGLAGSATADSGPADLAWIGQLPGVSLLSNRATGRADKTVYTLSGNVDATFDAVTRGLTERGWTIVKSTNTPVGGIVARTLQAEKNGARLKASAQDVGGISHLTLSVTSGDGRRAARARDASGDEAEPPAPPAAPAAPRAPAAASAPEGSSAPSAPAASAAASGGTGHALVLGENNVEGTYDCGGRDVTIGGDRCRVTLQGSCRSLKVLGNGNRVTVDGSISSIQTLGERNHVTWSAARNPRPPKVVTIGGGNRVRADER